MISSHSNRNPSTLYHNRRNHYEKMRIHLVGVLAVIAAAAAVLVALDRFRKQTDEDPNDFED